MGALSRWLALAILVTASGCATAPLNSARGLFYTGQPDRAAETLEGAKAPERDRALLLMERGTMWQAAGDFDKSSRDLIAAADTIEEFETLSLSSGTGSMVVNDTLNRYSGFPFEHMLLHNLTALNHLASGRRDEAGVEARRVLNVLNRKDSEPGSSGAFGWYMAGLGLEVADDKDNAVNAYARARELNPNSPNPIPNAQELVYVVLVGRGPHSPNAAAVSSSHPPPSVTVESGGFTLGHAVSLADTHDLMFRAAQAAATKTAVKTLGRIAAKEAIAHGVASEYDNPLLGELIRIILIGILERPDERHWDTLPRWLMIARIPISENPETVHLRLNGRRMVTPLAPPVRYGNTWFCFSRILN